jgi:hypothetical protein
MLRLAFALPFFLAGCSVFGDFNDGDCGDGALSGTLTATAGGRSFSDVCLQGRFTGGTLAIGGTLGAHEGEQQGQIDLTVQGAQAGQTYAFGLGNPGLTAAYSELDANTPTAASRLFTAGAGSGSVTVLAVSASGASGTFRFTGVNDGGASLAVTGGRFEVEF